MQKVDDRVTLDQVHHLELILLSPIIEILTKTSHLKQTLIQLLQRNEPEKLKIMESDGLIWNNVEDQVDL